MHRSAPFSIIIPRTLSNHGSLRCSPVAAEILWEELTPHVFPCFSLGREGLVPSQEELAHTRMVFLLLESEEKSHSWQNYRRKATVLSMLVMPGWLARGSSLLLEGLRIIHFRTLNLFKGTSKCFKGEGARGQKAYLGSSMLETSCAANWLC